MDGAKEKINKWFDEGKEITIFTTRPDYDYSTVEIILKQSGIKFNRLVCGKPSYDVFIDDKAIKFEGWKHDYTIF